MINSATLRFGGAVQVALSVIQELRKFPQHEYHVVVGEGVGGAIQEREFPANFFFYERSFGKIRMQGLRRVQRTLSSLEKRVAPDCVLTTSGPAYWRTRAPHLIGFNLPLYIYGDSPYVKDLGILQRAKLALRKSVHLKYFRRDADAIIVQTDDVNSRVSRLLPGVPIFTVSNTCNGWFDLPRSADPKLPKKPDGVFRFVTITSYYPHKNIEILTDLIKALPTRLKDKVEFVVTLSEAEYRTRVANAVPTQLKLIGNVLPHECPSLYEECDAMFLPTLAECFSASYPEAMKMSKPIVTSDLPFARSICKDAALYFNAKDPVHAAQRVANLIEDSHLQDHLRRRGKRRLGDFDTPSVRARKILSICKDLSSH